MKKILPHLRPAIILTPAIFMLAFWMMTLSSSSVIADEGKFTLLLWALLLSFGVSYSISMFVHEMLNDDA